MLVEKPAGFGRPEHGSIGWQGHSWRTKLPFFYGWIIVASAFISLGLCYTVWYSFSVFYVALLEEFGWSRAASAGVFSLFVVVSGIAGAGTGALADRIGSRKVVSVGVVMLSLGLVACSRITNLMQFYLFFGILAAIGLSGTGWIPCVAMINRWFSARLGTALGISSAGIGVGILVMVPFSQWLISQLGWRTAYLVLACIILMGILPASLILMRSKPEDLGLKKDGRESLPVGSAGPRSAVHSLRIVDKEWASIDWTVRKAVLTPRFWFLCTMMFMVNLSVQMVFVHQVAFLVGGGYDKLLAASIVGFVGILSVGAKISWGWISDRLGREVTWTLGLGSTILAISLLIATRYATYPVLIYLFALAFAAGYGATAPITPAVAADIFAGRHFGAIYGVLGIAANTGSAAGAWLAGYIYDLTGGYLAAFGLGMCSGLISLIAVWLVAPRKVRLVPGKVKL